MKSLSVRPSILCVQISTTTFPQASCKSGWCPCSSAMAPMRSTKASALLKSLSLYVLRRCWSRTDSQPGSSWRSSSAIRSAPSGGTPPRQVTHCWSASTMAGEVARCARDVNLLELTEPELLGHEDACVQDYAHSLPPRSDSVLVPRRRILHAN